MGKHYLKRGDWYYFIRRVPEEISPYDPRKQIRIALKTKDEREAVKRVAIYNDFIEKYWRDLVRSGSTDPGSQRYAIARRLAKAYGFAYQEIAENAQGPLPDLVRRLEVVAQAQDDNVAPALLGGTQAPSLRLNECLPLYWPACADRFVGKSPHQVRKYKHPRSAALANFIAVIGDLELRELKRCHILKFKDWFLERISRKEISADTANKQMRHVRDIIDTVTKRNEMPIKALELFSETRLKVTNNSRPPFEASYVDKRFVQSSDLNGLNPDAQILVFMMIETGARESEIIGLAPEDFFMDAPVPHVWIRKNEVRDIKTLSSTRKIPLSGIALLAARQIAKTGMLRYQDQPDAASATINKYLRENDLKPTSKHTLYSLRHCFKDRLRDIGAPGEVIDELMGHAKHGPQYGRGHTLETKSSWLEKIAFPIPTDFMNRISF